MEQKKIIFTGGDGLLGSEFKKVLPDLRYTDVPDFDVTNYDQINAFVKNGDYHTIFHAAAFTSPPRIDKEPETAIMVNIIGTANVVRLCIEHQLRLIYMCTDYVFKGDKGNYTENDPVLPVNKYAWSKLGGECSVRLYENSLIIRTSFGENVFPYEKAFIDQWTSRESASVIVSKITKLLERDVCGVVHVGGDRKTVFEYAKSLDPDKEIGELSIHDVSFTNPVDTSLNCERYKNIINE